MSYGVNAVPYRMEASRSNPSVDFFFAETVFQQLPPCYHPMLPPREDRYQPIIPAKPRQPFLKTG
jgi:hypothetical protein